MDIGQAVKRLKSGEKIRRPTWEDKEQFLDPDMPEDTDLMLSYEDLVANDWEVVDG